MIKTEFEVAANVYKTSDYSVFKYLEGNRQVSPQRLKKIIKSIDTVGYIEPSPVLVNKDMQVIDGQGRIEACKSKGLPVYFVIAENAGIDECQQMNIGQSNWGLNDYVSCYASLGNENYIRMLNITTLYPLFTLAEIYGVCTNSIAVNGYSTIVVKNGDLELSADTYKRVLPILDYVAELAEVLDSVPGSSRVKKTGVAWIIANTPCNRKRLQERLFAEYPVLSPVVEKLPTLFLSQLSDIYNKRLSKNNCLYFDTLYKQFLKDK